MFSQVKTRPPNFFQLCGFQTESHWSEAWGRQTTWPAIPNSRGTTAQSRIQCLSARRAVPFHVWRNWCQGASHDNVLRRANHWLQQFPNSTFIAGKCYERIVLYPHAKQTTMGTNQLDEMQNVFQMTCFCPKIWQDLHILKLLLGSLQHQTICGNQCGRNSVPQCLWFDRWRLCFTRGNRFGGCQPGFFAKFIENTVSWTLISDSVFWVELWNLSCQCLLRIPLENCLGAARNQSKLIIALPLGFWKR